MAKILLIEPSATRRRALMTMLQAKGHELAPATSYSDGLSVISGAGIAPAVVVVSWPEYADQRANEIFAMLRMREWQNVPVLVLADSTDAGGVAWLMKRPLTSLLLWTDYSDTPEAINKLLSPTAQQPAKTPGDGRASLKILFVDDSPTVRVAFRRLLLSEGYQVEVASSAEEGLERAATGQFDIAIVDYFMPGDNGATMALAQDREGRRVLVTTMPLSEAGYALASGFGWWLPSALLALSALLVVSSSLAALVGLVRVLRRQLPRAQLLPRLLPLLALVSAAATVLALQRFATGLGTVAAVVASMGPLVFVAFILAGVMLTVRFFKQFRRPAAAWYLLLTYGALGWLAAVLATYGWMSLRLWTV